ncbi:hypothetical protein SUGI_1344250 [Cryptomeria japonica]|uniref:TF-B3 domain-containing protein n=1 Tax=Cryptomeria japonica TaxID=3369 RepID=A0AAD3NTE7_CRYJA|nr:hypothetical protein SUGI_1344250 [Cryptomeria japonica]
MEIEETGEHYMPCPKCSQKCYKKHREKEYFDGSASFFKIMLGDFAEKLRIPPAFVSQIINDQDEHMVLQGPDGQNFNVRLWRSIKKLELQHGWINFVNYYGLEVGDLLVFKYISKSCFKVKIFDKTSCEKNQRIQSKSSFQGNSSHNPGHSFVSEKHGTMESDAPFISDKPSCTLVIKYNERSLNRQIDSKLLIDLDSDEKDNPEFPAVTEIQRTKRMPPFLGNSSSHKLVRMESVAPFKSDKPFCTMDLKSWNVNQPHVLEDNQAEEGDDKADGLAMNDANEEENGDREDGMAIHKVDEEEDKEDGSTNHEVVESKANDEADNGGNTNPKEEKVNGQEGTDGL